MSTKPIFVATHPRACSTAFERVFMTRRSCLQTIHEPFGDAFYFGPERMGSRFEADEEARMKSGFSESTFKTIVDRIESEAAEGKRVFIKDITYYLVPPVKQSSCIAPSLQDINPALQKLKRGVGTEGQTANPKGGVSATEPKDAASDNDSGVDVDTPPTPTKAPPFPYENTHVEPDNPTVVPRKMLEKFHFTFLIRHPRSSVPSYYRCCIPPLLERTQFTEYMPEEAGYDELRRFFDYCKDTGLVGPKVCGQGDTAETKPGQIEICVVDADDMLDNPEGVLRKYCESIGLDFTEEMLNWDTDESHQFAKQQFAKWDGWHDDAIHSRDLKPRQHKKTPKSDEELYADWVKLYGQEAADVIKRTVEANVADYEYLKQFAIKV